jgi:hypothetical protein
VASIGLAHARPPAAPRRRRTRIPDAFIADDAAFDGIINHLALRRRVDIPIAAVRIR